MNADDFFAVYVLVGERTQGAIFHKGDAWPRDLPVWTCEHRHERPSEAQACADDELTRRLSLESS